MDDPFIVEFSGPLNFEGESPDQEEALPLKVRGLSCRAGYIESKHFILPDSELENIAESLREGIDGYGAYLLKDHGGGLLKSVDSLIGRVSDATIQDSSVYYSARLEDADVADKIRKKLITSSSVGLKINSMSCSLCGKAYGDPSCNHILGREYKGEKLTELARPYLDKPIGAIVGSDIEAREQSVVLFPAIEGASVGFNFSEETSDTIKIIEERKFEAVKRVKEIANPDLEDNYVVGIAIQLIENRTNKIVMDADDYQAQLTELETLRAREDTNKKVLWLLRETDQDFSSEMMSKDLSLYSLDQLASLYSIFQGLQTRISNLEGVVADERESYTTESRKEDLRELIFGVRRDGTPQGKIRDIKDIR